MSTPSPISPNYGNNQLGMQNIYAGFVNPQVVPTSGGVGALYLMLGDESGSIHGLFIKTDLGITTNWEKFISGSAINDKDAVQAASTADIPLAGAFPLNIDGVVFNAVDAGARVLLKNQASGAENGIYNVTDAGAGNYLLVRSSDANNNEEVTQGLFTWAIFGTVNARTGWILSTPNPIVVDTTPLTFIQTPIPASGMENVDTFILTPVEIAAKQVTLSAIPATPANTDLTIESAGPTLYATDYTVVGNTLDWNGLGLDGVLIAGDILVVRYFA